MVRIIEPNYEILFFAPQDVETIEEIGRVAYKSEDKIAPGTAEEFVKMIIKRGHESVLEHSVLSVRFISNRGFSHELVRHRLCAFTQESTRWINYASDKFGNEITVILPYWFSHADILDGRIDNLDATEMMWLNAMNDCEAAYFDVTNHLNVPKVQQAARGVLPNDLKTEIVCTANWREWRHIFALRTGVEAHPDMQRLMRPLLAELREKIPVVFDDVGVVD